MPRIRHDLIGAVYCDGRPLMAGDSVPAEVQLSESLLEHETTPRETKQPSVEITTDTTTETNTGPVKPKRKRTRKAVDDEH